VNYSQERLRSSNDTVQRDGLLQEPVSARAFILEMIPHRSTIFLDDVPLSSIQDNDFMTAMGLDLESASKYCQLIRPSRNQQRLLLEKGSITEADFGGTTFILNEITIVLVLLNRFLSSQNN
jgi:hypothetical protein